MMLMRIQSKIFNGIRGKRALPEWSIETLSSILNVYEYNSRRINTSINDASLTKELQEIFKFKDTNVSTWIVENKARELCFKYLESEKNDKQEILKTLASRYGIQHNDIYNAAKKLISTEPDNERKVFSKERNLKNILIPQYQWLFVIIGRLECGVKFLVDLRTDALELMSEPKNIDKNILIQQLNLTLQDLFLLWFSVGFLHLERITWQSSCDMLQKSNGKLKDKNLFQNDKISDYEAIHPIKNWLDLKRRVGPYRRCYIFTHPSMPREPLVILHTALCDIIPESVKGIEEAEARILGGKKDDITFLEEDKCKIKAAIFYSIASTQKGLQGIELGNYLIKEVADEITTEFPMLDTLSSLSPIPNFRTWMLDKLKQNVSDIFTKEECKAVQNYLKQEDVAIGLKKVFSTSLWTGESELCEIIKKPLLRACAWYLYKEKRRNYALNNVANFHLRNGAVMWRINWMADPSPRGVGNSCGIMVNYRYYLNDCEKNSRDYIENYCINASEDVINLAIEAEKLIVKS